MMLLLFTTLVAAFSLTSAASIPKANCASHPNSTDNALHAFDGSASDQMDLVSVSLTDKSGKPMYPLHAKQPFVITVVASYKGVVQENIKVDISLAHWGDLSGICSWDYQIVPFLHNLPGCITTKCPVNAGQVTFKLPMDLSPIAGIIDSFGHNQLFQITVTVKDSTGKVQLGQVVNQLLGNDP